MAYILIPEVKRQVYGTVGIGFLAGPIEVLILAGKTAVPERIATNLLA